MNTGGESAIESKNADYYSKQLCDIITSRRGMDKTELFEKIFEILDQEVRRSIDPESGDADQQLWYDTCNKFCTKTQIVKDILTSIFYTRGKPIIKAGVIMENIGLPRILFFELLLYLIEKLDEKSEQEYNKEYFERFVTAVNRSDDAGILSCGVSDIEYFMFVTTENHERITPLLSNIDSKFEGKFRKARQGNYTLAHVIGSYCSEILIDKCDKSPSQPDSQPESQPDSLLNAPDDWHSNITLATPAEIAEYNKTHAQKLDAPPADQCEVIRKQREQEERFSQLKSDLERLQKYQERLKQELSKQELSKQERPKQERPKPKCFYDGTCYQQDKKHWDDFDHPSQDGPVSRHASRPASRGGRGGRRHQSKKSKHITVRCTPSSIFSLRPSTRVPRRRRRSSSKRRHTRRRRRH